MRPEFVMYCGLPASGKSTMARIEAHDRDAVYLSSDEIRKELFGDESSQEDNGEVFDLMNRRAAENLSAGRSVVHDACNISSKRRIALLRQLDKYEPRKICKVEYTPYEKCLEYNQNRERQVPEYVIKRMLSSFCFPHWFEGWNQIGIDANFQEMKDSGKYGLKPLFYGENGLCKIPHENHHHSLTIGDHILATYLGWKEREKDCDAFEHVKRQIETAALFHDIGKPFVKAFKNSKGEETSEAHYYQHHLVSAYFALPYVAMAPDVSQEDMIEILSIIQYHMHPYFWEKDGNEKMRNKYNEMWGEDLYKKIMILHELDQEAH